MAISTQDSPSEDPWNLARFVSAQEGVYARALAELRAGEKQSHWMWFIFPQLVGLGSSSTAQRYGIRGLAEAKAYLDHPILGPRLVECMQTILTIPDRSAFEIFGSPDDLKLRSCATLFAELSSGRSIFTEVLERFFEATPDPLTLQRLYERPQPDR